MTTPLQCPQCGAETPLPSGERLLTCAFCDAALYVDRSGLVSHYRLPRLLGCDEAERELRRWMAGNQTVKGLDEKAEDVRLAALSFPLWMFRLRTPGGEVVRAQPAAATTEPALADLQVPAGELEPWRAPGEAGGEAAGTSPGSPEAAGAGGEAARDGAGSRDGVETVAATVPLETAREWLRQQADGPQAEITETALVHVPLWRATYTYAGRSHSAVVEGSTGVVLASVFPAKAESPYVLVAALGLLLFTGEGLLITDLFWKAVAYLLTGGPLVLLGWWVARKV